VSAALRPLALATLAACASATAPAREPVTLGVVASLTGDIGSLGGDSVDAMNLAASEINDAGGVLGGRPLRLQVEDDGTTESGAREAFARLTQRQVPVVVGPLFSSGVTAVASQIKETETLTVSPSASSPALTALDDGGFFFRVIPSDTVQGVVLARLVVEAGRKNLCVVHRNDAYGEGLADVASRELASMAPDIAVVRAGYDPLATDLGGVLAPCEALANLPEPAIAFVTFGGDGGELIQSAGRRGLRPERGFRYFGVDGNYDPALPDRVDDPTLLEGMLGTAPFAPAPGTPEGERHRRFEQRFQDRFGRSPTGVAANSYDATYVAALSVELAGTDRDRAAVARAITRTNRGPAVDVFDWKAMAAAARSGGEVDLRGVTGDVSFDTNGDLAAPWYFAVWAFRGGVLVRERVVTVER